MPASNSFGTAPTFCSGWNRVVPIVEKPGQHRETLSSITRVLGDGGESIRDEVCSARKLKLYAGSNTCEGYEGEKQMGSSPVSDGAGTLNGNGHRAERLSSGWPRRNRRARHEL
jgi:hypothetical protein